MHPDSIKYTAFLTPQGHFEFTVMPFGLKQAPGWFQMLMNHVLHEEINKICVVYPDDIIIFSKSRKQHRKDLKRIFQKLHQAQLQIKWEKCKFFLNKIEFVGYEITDKRIKTNSQKVEAMRNLPTPTTRKNVQECLGLFNYYKKFIEGYAKIATPIYKLLKKDQEFD